MDIENLKVKNKEVEDVSITYTNFILTYKDKEIKVLVTDRFSGEIGEMDREIEIENCTNFSLEEIKEIENFVDGQK